MRTRVLKVVGTKWERDNLCEPGARDVIVLKGEKKREERRSYGDGKSPPKQKVELLKEATRVQRKDRAPEDFFHKESPGKKFSLTNNSGVNSTESSTFRLLTNEIQINM